ncbi:hypothetical protein QIG45_27225, partial [Klebsiella pneumoniae]|nr:hypothetical protein [Klebsiella pneumoniae]
ACIFQKLAGNRRSDERAEIRVVGQAMRRNRFNKIIKPGKNRKQDLAAAAPLTEAASSSSSPFIRASVRKPGPA